MSSFPSGHNVTADEFNATNNVKGFTGASAADTTTSSAFVNMASASFNFTKTVGTGTGIRIDMGVQVKTTVAGDVPGFAVNINGTDYTVMQGQLDVAGGAQFFVAVHPSTAPNLAAGTYTIQGRWRRVSGTGTLTRLTTHWVSIVATEVYL